MPGSLDCRCDRGGGHWSFETVPGLMRPESMLPPPRSGVWEACRRRLGARASFQLQLWLEKEAGAARRLNGRLSLRDVGCYGAPLHAGRDRSSPGADCGDAPEMSRTYSPNPARC
jgi:hypothetical protein